MQTLANVLNIRIEQMDGMIGPAFGIALLAAYHCGCFDSLEQISEGTVKIQNCFEPEPYAVAACEEQYKKLGDALEEYPAMCISLGEKLLNMLGLSKDTAVKKL